MKILFNYYELIDKSRNDDISLITLAYSLIKPVQKPVFLNYKNLQNTLYVDKVPFELFSRKYLHVKNNRIYRSFKIKDPQCYFRNPEFLTYKIAPAVKRDYLYILSNRQITNNTYIIPKIYIDEEFHRNPLVTVDEINIILQLEK